MNITYKTYERKASENRTPCTIKLSHNVRMESPKDRLKQARAAAGFKNPTDAARSHPRDLNINTLISNENGTRPISRKAAEKYGRVFGVDPGWLLFGGEVATTVDKRLQDAVLSASDAPPIIKERIINFITFELEQLNKPT
ncbi:putative conserved protein [Rhizobium favelukesii]|uniref:Conserved protein n=1 Tax=Rhizobium favelukesii TaxID=348824 RepID=W6R8Q1_9HYPH|nr:putative conserved protein [Rhizobium favelukesii]